MSQHTPSHRSSPAPAATCPGLPVQTIISSQTNTEATETWDQTSVFLGPSKVLAAGEGPSPPMHFSFERANSLSSWKTWVGISALLLSGCVVLGKWSDLSVTWCAQLQNGCRYRTQLRGLVWRSNPVTRYKQVVETPRTKTSFLSLRS